MIASDPFIFPRSLSSYDSSKIKHAVIAISVFLLRAYLCSILGIRSDKEEWKQEKAKERKKMKEIPFHGSLLLFHWEKKKGGIIYFGRSGSSARRRFANIESLWRSESSKAEPGLRRVAKWK